MVITVVSALAGMLSGGSVAFLVVSGRRKRFRRVALHMKPGHGPSVEGLLVSRGRREFGLVDAEILNSADDTTELGRPVRVLRENVFGYEVLG